jgi:tetratricopeptide (TPR) repeat protein
VLIDISKAIELAPETARYYVGRAGINEQMGESDQALNDACKALNLAEHPDFYIEYVKICMSIGKASDEKKKYFRQAESCLRAGLYCLEPSKECVRQLGVLFELKNELAKANRYYRKADKMDISTLMGNFSYFSQF